MGISHNAAHKNYKETKKPARMKAKQGQEGRRTYFNYFKRFCTAKTFRPETI